MEPGMEEKFRMMDSHEMRSMMEKMMPSMMEQCHAKMSGDEMISMMHDMMPKMMESCFSKMDTTQREGMISMCREMLDQIQAKYLAQRI